MRIESVERGASGTATVAAGGSSFVVCLEQLESLGLSANRLAPGAELDEDEAGLLALAAEAREAERRGLALLARAEQSAFMLRGKLELRGFSARAAGLALGRLSAQGWLDDARFARAFAASRLSRKAEGPASLAAALRSRGVAAETAAASLAAVLDPDTRREALARAYAKEFSRARGDPGAARSRLRALGFSASEIAQYLEDREA